MAAQRIFFVTQESLSIWTAGIRGPERIAVFSGAGGVREFDAYISLTPEHTAAMLVDVIEEEFALETIPKLNARDRKSLIARRSERKYRRTPYRLSEFQGKAGPGDAEFSVLHSAISNRELLDPWLEVIQKHRVALSGIYSVPLMAPTIISSLARITAPTLFIASHQDTKLRQIFMKGGHLISARLSQSPGIDQEGYAQFIVTEAQRSRRYLERLRILSSMEILEVRVVADSEMANRISKLGEGELSTQFSFIAPEDASGKLLGETRRNKGQFEIVYLSKILKRRPKCSYATSGENRFWTMRSMRYAIMGGATAVAVVCSMLAAYFLNEGVVLRDDVARIRAQVQQLTETYRAENDKFGPILAGSHEMKLAVDTGDHILLNRLPVPWVMNQLGAVLGKYPEIQVRELTWQANLPAAGSKKPNRRGNRPTKVSVPEVEQVDAILTADITSFDGDMRKAFARIDQLTSDLESQTFFSEAATEQYPLNANPAASVSGEIGTDRPEFARFRIRATYNVADAAGMGEG